MMIMTKGTGMASEWNNRIKYHRPNESGIAAIATMREHAHNWGMGILDRVPEGREQAIALTKIEEALFWANAGIAREPSNWDNDQS